jgi:hypothetical protein
MKKKEPIIMLERSGKDRLIPRDFFEILTHRYLPVISLTYISSVVGIAAQKDNFSHYMFDDKSAYVMALYVALWVSIPALLWAFVKCSHLYNHVADAWYKICAVLMIVFLGMSYILFPEADALGLRTYFAATIPMLFILYFFFVKGGLPPFAAHPLTALGLTFLFYGAAINFLHH